jgi:phage shock protein C
MEQKKLYKSRKDSYIDGVCGGIAEYFNIDSTLVRLAFIVFCFAGGSGILAYIIAACVIPRAPKKKKKKDRNEFAPEFDDDNDDDREDDFGNGPRM